MKKRIYRWMSLICSLFLLSGCLWEDKDARAIANLQGFTKYTKDDPAKKLLIFDYQNYGEPSSLCGHTDKNNRILPLLNSITYYKCKEQKRDQIESNWRLRLISSNKRVYFYLYDDFTHIEFFATLGDLLSYQSASLFQLVSEEDGKRIYETARLAYEEGDLYDWYVGNPECEIGNPSTSHS